MINVSKSRKRKEKKGPKIASSSTGGSKGSTPFVGIFSTHPNHRLGLDSYLASRRLEEHYYDIETYGDEYLEEQVLRSGNR